MPEESKGAKDDLRDAWARADELRTGRIRTRVYKPPKHLTALRCSGCLTIVDTYRPAAGAWG
jgi:hypothetical protein